jgi:cell wall-associated NlpC family hydrolase
MTRRVSALPHHLLSLANAMEACALTVEVGGRRMLTGRAEFQARPVFALAASSREIGEAVHRVASRLHGADVWGGAALPIDGARTVSHANGTAIDDVLRIAASQLGVREGKTNMTAYGAWFGANGQQWCAQFVSWVFAQAGRPLPMKGIRKGVPGYAYCQYGRDAAYARGELFRTPRVGDVFFHFNKGDAGSGHTGIVTSVKADGIEGNTGPGIGGVRKRLRNKAYVSGLTFWRVLPPAEGDNRGIKERAKRPSTVRRARSRR